MTTLARLVVMLTADIGGFSAEMEKASLKAVRAAEKAGRAWQRTGDQLAGIGSRMTMTLTAPIVAGAAFAVDAFSDLNESTNAVNVVFGESAKVLLDYGQTAAQTAGLATSEFNQMAAQTGAFLKNVGFDLDGAAGETIKLTERASDMASIFNTDVSQALGAIQSGLKGEFNPLEQFGVKLNAAAISAKAMQMGLVDSTVDMTKLNGLMLDAEKAQAAYNIAVAWYGEDSFKARDAAQSMAEIQGKIEEVMAGSAGEISDTAKAQAALALIYEQTNQFAGDFINTSGGLANSLKIAGAEFKDVAASIGGMLLPYAMQLLGWVREAITWFSALDPSMQRNILIVLGLVAVLGPLLIVIGSIISAVGVLIPIFTAIGGAIAAVSAPVWLTIAAVLAALALLYAAWTNNWGGIQEKTAAVIDFIRGVIDSGMQFISDLTSGKLGALSQIWNNVLSAIQIYWTLFTANIRLILQAFTAAFHGDWYAFGALIRMAWDNLWTAVGFILQTAWANTKIIFSNMVKSIIDFFKNTDWGSVGKSIIEGIAKGITAFKGVIDTAAKNAANAALQAAKGFLGIRSPSRLFEMEVGWQMAAGTAQGWENGIGRLMPDSLSGVSTSAVLPSFSGLAGVSTATGGGGGRTVVVPVTYVDQSLINTNSEYEAKRRLRDIVESINREQTNQ